MPDSANERGFSLIESLIACALLATALLSVGHLSTTANVLLMDSRGRTMTFRSRTSGSWATAWASNSSACARDLGHGGFLGESHHPQGMRETIMEQRITGLIAFERWAPTQS